MRVGATASSQQAFQLLQNEPLLSFLVKVSLAPQPEQCLGDQANSLSFSFWKSTQPIKLILNMLSKRLFCFFFLFKRFSNHYYHHFLCSVMPSIYRGSKPAFSILSPKNFWDFVGHGPENNLETCFYLVLQEQGRQTWRRPHKDARLFLFLQEGWIEH